MKISKKILLAGASLLMVAAPLSAVPVSGTTIVDAGAIVAGSGQILTGGTDNNYFVTGGTLTLSDVTMTNFTATGGAGSGGGAGMGGAIFVNTGAAAILTNVNFTGNSAVGGQGGVGSIGGSLNGLPIFNIGVGATAGANGDAPIYNSYLDANGANGFRGLNGAGSLSGFGGVGGNGSAGTGGDAAGAAVPYILAVTSATANLVALGVELVGASANPFTISVAVGITGQVVNAGIDLGSSVAELVYFDNAVAAGQIGVGGSGGAGGNAGAGGFGFGGVTGGDGGAGGAGSTHRGGSAVTGGAAGGDGGDGGVGGLGGFGAGGGSGGNGGAGGAGAVIGARDAIDAVAPVYSIESVPYTGYEKGYYTNPLDPETFVAFTPDESYPGGVNEFENPGLDAGTLFDHDNDDETPEVTIVYADATFYMDVEVLETPGSPGSPAMTAGTRPDGLTGAGGAGGAGGFGAGAGTSGAGSDPQIAGGAGGSGMGGAIFVRTGGTLTITGDALFDGNSARGGDGAEGTDSVAAGAAGNGYGADLFMMTGSTVILDPGIGKVITFNGGIADDSAASDVDSSIASGNGAGITIQSGLVIFNAVNTYSGRTTIQGGVLQAQDGEGIHPDSNITFAGGVLQSNGDFTRYLGSGVGRVQWTGSGGFAAEGGALNVRLNNGQKLTWGSGSFVPVASELIFGSDSATDTVYFSNAIDLAGGDRTILVAANGENTDYAFLTGVLSNGSLTVGDATHTGILVSTAANTYAGGTTINGGTFSLAAGGSITGALVINAAFDITAVTGDGTTIGTLAGGSTGTIHLGSKTLAVNQSDDGTYAGVISDGGLAGGTGGGLIKTGPAELTLTGANTYTGATQVSDGTLTLGTGGSLASLSILIDVDTTLDDLSGGLDSQAAVTANGTFQVGSDETIDTLTGSGSVVLAGGDLTVTQGAFSGVISATGSEELVKAGGAETELTLTGANTFTGRTHVTGGTLTLGTGGSLASTTVLIDSGTTLNNTVGGFASGATVTNNGTLDLGTTTGDTIAALVNTGTLNGTVTLTATTYTLNTDSVINANLGAGTLIVGGDALLAGTSGAAIVNILADGHLSLASADRLSDDAVVTLDGTLSLLGGDDTIKELHGDGTLNVGSNHLIVTNGGDFTGTVNMDSETNLDVTGGTLSLTGTTNVEGTLTVGAGATLSVDDSAELSYGILTGDGTVTVADPNLDPLQNTFYNGTDSTVAGTLTFSGNFTNNGTFAPGNSPGITDILGDYTENATLQMELGGLGLAGVDPNGFDQVRISGTVTVNPSATLIIQGYNSFEPSRGQTFQIISDIPSGMKYVSGNFGSVLFDLDGVAGGGSPLVNAAVVFDLDTGRLIATGLNAPGSAFTDLAGGTDQQIAINAIFGAAQVAPNQIRSTTAGGQFAEQIIADPSAIAFFVPDSYGALLDYGRSSSRLYNRILEDRVNTFNPLPTTASGDGSVFGGMVTSDTDTGDRARFRRNDCYAGADLLAVKGFTFGVLAAFNDGRIDHDFGRTETEGVGGGVYMKADIDAKLSAFGSFGYTGYEYDVRRRTYNGSVTASPSSQDYTGNLGVRYLAWSDESFSVAPRAALTYSHTEVNSFTESGASDAMHVSGFGSDRLAAQLGASGVWTTRALGNALSVELTGAVERKLVDNEDDMNVTLVNSPGARYPIRFADEGDTAFVYGVNLGYNVYGPATIYLGYQGRVGGNDEVNFNAGVRVRF